MVLTEKTLLQIIQEIREEKAHASLLENTTTCNVTLTFDVVLTEKPTVNDISVSLVDAGEKYEKIGKDSGWTSRFWQEHKG